MESSKIEKILNAYFEGNTTLEEEATLRDYFNNHRVADHLLQYKPIFVGLEAAKEEQSNKTFQVPESEIPSSHKPWRYAVAAALILAMGVGVFYNSNTGMTPEEKEALVAFENSKKAMLFLSEKLNKGTEQLSYVHEFTIAKDMVFGEE